MSHTITVRLSKELASWLGRPRRQDRRFPRQDRPRSAGEGQGKRGRPLAAYLYLPHATGDKSARMEASADSLLVIDYAADDRPIGIEITAPEAVTLDRLNLLLRQLGQPPLAEADFRPLTAV